MKRRKKRAKVKPDDPIEMAFILRYQRRWTMNAIASHLSVSRKTAERYIGLYEDKGSRYWAGTRGKKTQPRKYGDEVRLLVKQYKEEAPARSAVTIHDLMQQRAGEDHPSIETIRRIIRDLGLSHGKPRDRAGYVKFERQFPNDLWQIDFKGEDHFGHLGKLSLLAIIDDCSRFVIAARWFPIQEEGNVILLLRDAFTQHGLPNEIISDNAAQFKTLQGEPLTRYCRLLALVGVRVLFHAPNHPQTKGKLERWFGTVMSKFVPEARRLIESNPHLTLAEFNSKFAEWIEWYNHRHRHSSLNGQAPAKVYTEHPNRVSRASKSTLIGMRGLPTSKNERRTSRTSLASRARNISCHQVMQACACESENSRTNMKSIPATRSWTRFSRYQTHQLQGVSSRARWQQTVPSSTREEPTTSATNTQARSSRSNFPRPERRYSCSMMTRSLHA